MRHERGEVDVPRREEVQLLQARDGLGLHQRVVVILHDGAAHQTAQPRRGDRPGVTWRQTEAEKPIINIQLSNWLTWLLISTRVISLR